MRVDAGQRDLRLRYHDNLELPVSLEEAIRAYALLNSPLFSQLHAGDIYTGTTTQSLSTETLAGPAWLPPPSLDLSAPPAGAGLSLNPSEWPKNSIRTAGGYTIVIHDASVAEKEAQFAIYGPGQKPGDEPLSYIWGDPHVVEKDGTRWDFTKDSRFTLPDGTTIMVDTTSETGQSVTQGIEIINGADRINVTGINSQQPALSAITHDGYQKLAEWTQKQMDLYRLGGDGTEIQWQKNNDGVVTGSHFDEASQRYEQNVDASQQAVASEALRPEVFSPAWGNLLRTKLVEQVTQMLSSLGPLAQPLAQRFATAMAQDHHLTQNIHAQLLMGGFPALAQNPDSAAMLTGLGDPLIQMRELLITYLRDVDRTKREREQANVGTTPASTETPRNLDGTLHRR